MLYEQVIIIILLIIQYTNRKYYIFTQTYNQLDKLYTVITVFVKKKQSVLWFKKIR